MSASPAGTTSGSPATTSPSPTPGHPCWVDVTPYPFGYDGNFVDPSSGECGPVSPFGAGWLGDFQEGGFNENPPCDLQVSSMAFRAWNRGLAAVQIINQLSSGTGYSLTNAFGVWLYNGSNWYPDPSFPGSNACPGSIVLWAGKLDYWLIGSNGNYPNAEQTLCRFDGVNLEWDEFKLPSATLAELPANQAGNSLGGVTSGICYAWNNCWFFGTDGVQVHWDGTQLSNVPIGAAQFPWLEGNFTSAAGGTDASGNEFGVAVTAAESGYPGSVSGESGIAKQPDGDSAPQVFDSSGGSLSPTAAPVPGQKGPTLATSLTDVASDSNGDVWVAGSPAAITGTYAQLYPMTEDGTAEPCAGYGPATFSASLYDWTGLAVFPYNGSALVGTAYNSPADGVTEPAVVSAACGQVPSVTTFQIPDPTNPDQAAATPVPADSGAFGPTVVAALADNDAWASTGYGLASDGQPERPHLYQWSDGQTPNAPAGNDIEPRPSVFTLDPPIYVTASPTYVPVTVAGSSKTKRSKTKKIKLKAPVYDVGSKLVKNSSTSFTLSITFKVRRTVRIGAEALKGKVIVSTSGIHRFAGHTGDLPLALTPSNWPTSLKFVVPKQKA